MSLKSDQLELGFSIVHPYIKELLILDPRCQVDTSESLSSLGIVCKSSKCYALLIEHAIKGLFIH